MSNEADNEAFALLIKRQEAYTILADILGPIVMFHCGDYNKYRKENASLSLNEATDILFALHKSNEE